MPSCMRVVDMHVLAAGSNHDPPGRVSRVPFVDWCRTEARIGHSDTVAIYIPSQARMVRMANRPLLLASSRDLLDRVRQFVGDCTELLAF